MKNWLLISVLAFLIVSCQKQSPDEIQPDYVDTLSEVRRGEACSRTNLVEDVLEYQNLKDLFICTQWDKKFPKMFESLEKVPEEAWEDVSRPVNDLIINNKSYRNKFISLVSELDKKEGLDDLSRVILTLSDSNYFHHVYEILKCTEEDNCKTGLTRDDVKAFFEFFSLSTEELVNFSKVVGATSSSLKASDYSIADSLGFYLQIDDFKRKRNTFLEALVRSFSGDRVYEELAFYKRSISPDNEMIGWFPVFLRQDLSEEEFVYLLRYPVDIQPEMWKDFRLIRSMLDVSIPCSNEGASNEFSVLVKEHLDSFFKILFRDGHSEFVQQALQSMLLLKGSSGACKNLSEYNAEIISIFNRYEFKHKIDFVHVLESSLELLSEEDNYQFIKLIQENFPESRNDDLFLIDLLSTDLYATGFELLKATDPAQKDLSKTLYRFINNLPDEGTIAIAKTITLLLEQDRRTLTSIEKTWSELGEEGRFFFFNFLDEHFKGNTNTELLLDFYNSLLRVSSTPLSGVLHSWFSEEKVEQSLVSLTEIFKELKSEELLEEYRVFFSRNHLIEILRLLSTGRIPSEDLASLEDFIVVDEVPREPVVLNKRVFGDPNNGCLAQIAKPKNDFTAIINSLPAPCATLVEEDPLWSIFGGLNEFSRFQQSNGLGPLNDKGLFSGDSIRLVTNFFNENERKLGGIENLKRLSKWTEKNESAIEKMASLSKLWKRDEVSLWDRVLAYYSREANFKTTGKLLDAVKIGMRQYQEYKDGNIKLPDYKYEQLEEYDCENYFVNTGGRACPSKEEVTTIFRRGVKVLTRKNDKNPILLEQLLKMIAVDVGMPIPYESNNPRYKRVTFSESFKMFYELTDLDIPTNQQKVKYREVPKALDNFFETEDWKVSRDQGKDTPKPREIPFTTMDRIETVIRDVRFDMNYLGAHYLNAVSKAEDYNKVVDTKFGLLKTCVPLKFCGKFMNRAQHDLARNGKETFAALEDVNTKNDWAFGDYMQALLTSIVSSSSDKSQVSTVVKRRILGLNIEIPWLNSKKTLINHNGQILSLVTMINGFTNGARVLRDRQGRTKESFENFMNSGRVKKLDDNLLRNYDPMFHTPELVRILRKVDTDGLFASMANYFSELDYEGQRLAESIIFKGTYITAYIADPEFSEIYPQYKNNSLFDLLPLIEALVDNHKNLSNVYDFRDKELLRKVNRLIDILIVSLENEKISDHFKLLLNEIILVSKDKDNEVVKSLSLVFEDEERLKTFEKGISGLEEVFDGIFIDENLDELERNIEFYLADESIDWEPLRLIIRRSVASKICESSDRCTQNPNHHELQDFVDFLMKDDAKNLITLLKYPNGSDSKKLEDLFNKIFPSLIFE